MTGAWDQAFAAAQQELGPLPLARADFETRARARLARRLARQGRGGGELAFAALLAHTPPGDLYLALALEDASPQAQEVLATRTHKPLSAVARALGHHEARVEEAVQTSLRGAASAGTAAYDGTSSLPAWLAVRLARGAGTAGCPPENVLAGLAEGTLEGREASTAAQHVETCTTCRAALDVLALAGLVRRGTPAPAPASGPPPLPGIPRVGWPPSRQPAPTARRPWLLTVLALGGVLALVIWVGGRGLWDSEARRQDTERSVERAARHLMRSDSGFFGDFAPYDRATLERAEADPTYEGFAAIFPRGKVLERTPSFLWSTGPEGARFVVTLKDESGETLWTRTVTGGSLAWPADAPPLLRELTYTWTVAPEGQPEGAEASFRVEAEQEHVRWERRKERLEKAVPDEGTRAVLTAQVALRRGYAWEAWTLVRAHLERYPKDRYGRALLEHIQRVHGLRP